LRFSEIFLGCDCNNGNTAHTSRLISEYEVVYWIWPPESRDKMSAPGTKQKFPNNVSWHMPSFLRGDYRSICRLCLSNIASGVSSQCIQSSSQITQSLLFLDSLMVSRH